MGFLAPYTATVSFIVNALDAHDVELTDLYCSISISCVFEYILLMVPTVKAANIDSSINLTFLPVLLNIVKKKSDPSGQN